MPSSRGSSELRDQTQASCIFCITGRLFTAEPLGKAKKPHGIDLFHFSLLIEFSQKTHSDDSTQNIISLRITKYYPEVYKNYHEVFKNFYFFMGLHQKTG